MGATHLVDFHGVCAASKSLPTDIVCEDSIHAVNRNLLSVSNISLKRSLAYIIYVEITQSIGMLELQSNKFEWADVAQFKENVYKYCTSRNVISSQSFGKIIRIEFFNSIILIF